MGSGGARPGAGRKKAPETTNIRVSREAAAKLGKMAKEQKTTVGKVVDALLR